MGVVGGVDGGVGVGIHPTSLARERVGPSIAPRHGGTVGRVAAPRLVETHLSLLLLTDDRVLKWKKPVAFDFIDLRSLDARRRNCEREVELNRRLAPDVYEGVAELHGPDGELWEPVVVMRRLPEERRLATLVRLDDPSVPAALHDVAEVVAAFHATAERSPQIAAHGRADAVAARWAANLRQLRGAGVRLDPGAADDLDAVERLVAAWLPGRSTLLDARADEGHVVDGHGDLQADDVFLLDTGPAIIDCLEFDDGLRAVDVADDAAFLAMDLEHLGRADLATAFVDHYDAACAARGLDPLPRHLVDVWAAYRAVVRAMVTCLRVAQSDPTSPEHAAGLDDVAVLVALARRRLEAAEVRLVLVGGSPGTGKSKLARGLAAAHGWPVIRSDEVRREVLDAAGAPGRYEAAQVDRVYDAVLDAARPLLARGETVVLDATWGSAARRAEARAAATGAGARTIEVRCVVDPETAAARVARRAAKGADVSEATPEVALRLAAAFDPWDEAVEVDTSGPAEETLAVADRAIGTATSR